MSEPASSHILIADDEPLFLKTTAALLRKAGFRCTTAANGKAALEALSREPFDLVLCDLNMPGISSWSCCAKAGRIGRMFP